MKIFQICNKSPYPPIEGGAIAMNNITQGLIKAGHFVKVLAVNTPKYNIKINELPEDYKKNTCYESLYIDTSIKITDAFFNLFTGKSYNVERFISKKFENKIIEILSFTEFDVIQLESIFIAPYIDTIRRYSKAKIVLRAHNIEHLIWDRLAENCNSFIKKKYLKHLAKTLKKYEYNTIEKVDGVAAITQHDADFFINVCSDIPIIDIPVGINFENIDESQGKREFPGLFHIGSMDWIPNQEGVRWFIFNVWNEIIKTYPDLKVFLAGRNMPQWLKNLNIEGVIVAGEVSDAHNLMQSKSIMIVPLLSGSGMRVKIVEGMAYGNTIISTTIGAEGISCINNENILIADNPSEFILAIGKCLNNPDYSDMIGSNAKQLIKKMYDNSIITEKLIQFYNSIIQVK
ncbi:MAG: glycosyltransferase family 4 protein [Bacteroidetes bacterium]|nr:glycosyltransferase family 4 protein [Bacteroidota bacterium]